MQVPDVMRHSTAPVVLHPAGEQLPSVNYASSFAAHVRAGATDRQLLVTMISVDTPFLVNTPRHW